MEKYSLTLTSKQLSVIIDATELLARLLRKQSFSITDRLNFKDLSAENKLQELLDQAETYPESSETHQIAWDIYQTARHRLAWDTTPEGGITVNFDKPLHTSKEPLPTIVNISAEEGAHCIKSEKHLNGTRNLNAIKHDGNIEIEFEMEYPNGDVSKNSIMLSAEEIQKLKKIL